MTLLQSEMEWVRLYYASQVSIWMHRRTWAAREQRVGHECYALRQAEVWQSLLQYAVATFSVYSATTVSH